MAIEVREGRGQQYGPKNARRIYHVIGTLVYSEAVAAVFGGTTPLAPSQWGDISLADFNCNEIRFGCWDVEAIYASVAVQALNGIVQLSIDTSGATVHQTHTDLGGDQFPSGTGINFGGGIGIGQDMKVPAGIDVVTPRQGIEMKTRFSSAQVTAAYIATVYQATGRINSVAYRGYAAQELLFLGARLNQVNALEWDCNFIFQASYEKTGMTIGSVTGITKKGWQYLWTWCGQGLQTFDGRSTLVPDVHIVRCDNIYKPTNFNSLAIPGSESDPFGFGPPLP